MIKTSLLICCISIFFNFEYLEAQDLLLQEDFNQGIPSTWTTGDLNGNMVYWTYCENQGNQPTATCPGIFDGPANNQEGFNSTSVENGFAVFNSDGYGPIIHNTYLQTPNIDFTEQNEVWITFEYQIGVFQYPTINNMVLEVKAEGFWESIAIADIHPGNSPKPEFIRWSKNPEVAILNITEFAAGNTVQLRWRWLGSYEFYWALDDIQIFDHDPRALFLSEVDFEMACFHSFAPNFKTPHSQVESFPLLTDLFNRGYLPAQDAQLKATIFAGTNTAYSKSVTIPELANQSLIQNIYVDSFPPILDEIAIYNGIYSIGPLSNDPTPNNNEQDFQYWVTENTFAKEPGPAVYTRPSNSNWGNLPHDWAWGNIFYMPNGTGYEVANISFSIGPSNGLYFSDIVGTSISILLYEWEDINQDSRVQATERSIIGNRIYTIQGNENELSYITVNFDSEEVPLKDDTDYIAMIDFQAQNSASDIEIGSYVLMDYGSTIYATQQLGKPRFPSALWIRNGNSNVFETQGLGFNVIPSITMDIRPFGTPVAEIPHEPRSFNVFPNPSTGLFKIELLNDQYDNESLVLKVFNTLGLMVYTSIWESSKKSYSTIDLEGLANGLYQVTIATKSQKSIFTTKLLKYR